MAKLIEKADVYLWDTLIGSVTWQRGIGFFEYSKQFQRSGIELSPIKMPLSDKSYSFGGLSKETFKGLPGMLADSLPDKFGNRLIDQWLERNSRDPESFSPIERLCYIGSRGMGGLEFKPTVGKFKESVSEIQLSELVDLANEALQEKAELNATFDNDSQGERRETIEQIILVGTSAGGARAKAVIAWNKETNVIKTGQAPAGEGFDYYLLKFDGVDANKDKELLSDPKGFGLLEYAYYLMAEDAGVKMNECRLFKENGRSHFMTKRFDRLNGGDKIHMQSLCGIAHYDFNESGGYSYEQAIGVMREIGLSAKEIEQFYLRMVFNVVSVNQDDHTKNISFLMDQSGVWTLSPAYDITYSNGAGWTSKHQMTINGKTRDIQLDDLLAVAHFADISKAKAKKIIRAVVETVSNWSDYAKKSGLVDFGDMNELVAEVGKAHRLYLGEGL
ncbi:type II toxin-antitoxin system HipA family toxin [Marinomonas sp. IMCC 4694]|uniref:type II toxin-antitoxin system HipA family toxin n=1 Tax=Marinomonas sp. IMCC 4694 TaxID=2605432 RepID=UPI0011E67396|nr:type II toxin-antitoxin system HipA family toxin [Marinomonas sp. IMCC 4694]TYL46999.1 type II toxin-antitoxin system HipA family toxin [Marinomonas sp. IMCC 4694]